MKLRVFPDCGSAQRLALLGQDRPLGVVSRWRLDRHLGGCAECRAFVRDASALGGRLAPLMAPPVSETIVRRLRAEAVRAAPARLPAPAYRRLLIALPAAAAVLLVALAGPGLLARFDRAQQLDARLDQLQNEVALVGGRAPAPATRASLEDHLGGLEDTVRCLQTEVEDDRMDSSLEGATCLES